jgi:ABC-type lipoprotein export system ATPase subunit
MVTHDVRAATIADRILYLADGRSPRGGRSTAAEIIAAVEELSRS